MCALSALVPIYDWNITWLEVKLPINTTNYRERGSGAVTGAEERHLELERC